MKLLKSIILCGVGAAALSLTSCNDWLDINTDPNNPSAQSTPYELRLAHIEFYTNSGHAFADWRTGMQCGGWTRNYGGGTYWYSSYWCPTTSPVTTPYQWWFVGAYCNVPDMYDKAKADNNPHYAGVAKIIEAYGTMLMADLYGEMPFDDIKTGSATPVYNTGKELFQRCLQSLDEGIDLLEKNPSIDPSKPSLATGDWWNKGDVTKWVKLGYLLKARWLNHLNKKGEGKCVKDENGVYTTLKYDTQLILDCLDKAMTKNEENTVINHTDDNGPTHDSLGWDEPVDYSPLYSVCGMNSGYMVTKMLVDNLENFGGYGVEDPRADRIIPWAYNDKIKENPADGLKWKNGWRRSKGVDMQSGLNAAGGPLRAGYDATKGGWYIDSKNADRLGDTVYVEATSESKGYSGKQDLLYRRNGTDASKESGSFYSRVSAPTYVGTFAEACFIRAEVLFKMNDKKGAFTAYEKGVRASIELMNKKLKEWVAEDKNLENCPSFVPMEQAEIENFLAHGIGSQADLTLGHILTQKHIALQFSLEQWSDMRRYDFDPTLFFGWGIPDYYNHDVDCAKRLPTKQWRRWAQCSHEQNYNSTNLQAIGEKVPGARMKDGSGKSVVWYKQDDMYEIPVWWDSTQE